MKNTYVETINALERLHRLFLDVVRIELDRLKIQDISNVQTIIIFNIGNQELTVGEITNRGIYLGSNVSYNLKKMVKNGYIVQVPSNHDKRSSHIKLSSKGNDLYKKINTILNNHVDYFHKNGFGDDKIESLNKTLKNLEEFWERFFINKGY
jgi:DNA-binding MarR family transcriptional regulator